jgi:beta-aspartyl-peptidase (threonine type)
MAGAVAGVSRIKSPIEAAYAVMTESEHVLLTGRGAEEFAEENGLELVEPDYFYTEDRYQRLLNSKEKKIAKDTLTSDGTASLSLCRGSDYKYGTVGAVALDKDGNLAAGTSTGGMTNKRYGRVGDAPIIGAGTYADNNTCAVSATGHGEFFIRNVVAYDIAARMKYLDKDVRTASTDVINELKAKEGSGGVICLDNQGNIAMPFNTEGMYRGYIRNGEAASVFLYHPEE